MHKARLAVPCPFRAVLVVAAWIVKRKNEIIFIFFAPSAGDFGHF
jgi:hypothetical protein